MKSTISRVLAIIFIPVFGATVLLLAPNALEFYIGNARLDRLINGSVVRIVLFLLVELAFGCVVLTILMLLGKRLLLGPIKRTKGLRLM